MASFAIGRRKAQEEIFRSRETRLKEDSKTNYIAQWEEKNNIIREKQKKERDVKKLRENERLKVEESREKLRKLYEKEMKEWKSKVKNLLYISKEEKIEEIRDKANSLKMKRELERQEFVKKCYDRQWRDACDEARTLDSKARLDKLMHDRKNVVDCKETKMKAKEEAKQKVEWDKKMKNLNTKEAIENENRHQKNLEIKLALDYQVKIKQIKKEEQKRETRKEELAQLKKLKDENDELQIHHLKELETLHEKGRNVLKSNNIRREEIQREKISQHEKDLLLLKYAQEKETQQIKSEVSKKMKGKEISKDYLKYVHEQKARDESDNLQIEKIRKETMENILKQRYCERNAENDARKKLMEDVRLGRIEQIKRKEKIMLNSREEDFSKAIADKKQWRRDEENEQRERNRAKEKKMENMEVNKRLIEIKKASLAQESQQKHLWNKQIQYAEREHVNRLQSINGSVQNYFPLKHTSWYS